jgi:hypothetical protein
MRARPEIRPINARAETIPEKKMFSDAYAKRRCIVPMDAFYERDSRKKLHAFGMKDGTPFGVAGIGENWRNLNGEWERTFCIIADAVSGGAHEIASAATPPAMTAAAAFGGEADIKNQDGRGSNDLACHFAIRYSSSGHGLGSNRH